MAKKSKKSPTIIDECKGKFDEAGTIWTEREFSHPERTIRIATSFSGIGAPEKALERLGLKSQIVFACDIGERYLTYKYERLKEFTKYFNEADKEEFIKSLWEENKAEIDASRKKQGVKELTLDEVRGNILGECKDKDTELQLTVRCIELLCKHKGLTERSEIEKYVSSLYDKEDVNWQKETFFANHDIEEKAWHTDIRFMDATPYKGQVDLYVGGSPCQSYSSSGKRLGLDDMRGTLFYEFAKRIDECQPKVFIYENVKTMKSTRDKGKKSGLEAALEVFTSLGYKVYWQILDAVNYGIPQHRERIWVVGFREDTDFSYPASIPLTTRMYDYPDEESTEAYDGIPSIRHLTGKECMRLMGFTDFQQPEKMETMKTDKTRDRKICEMSGNSMVVDCIMALFRQMDITKYGEELPDPEKETDVESIETIENKMENNMDMLIIDEKNLEDMSAPELSDWIDRATGILNRATGILNRATGILKRKLKTMENYGGARVEGLEKECASTYENVSQQEEESDVWEVPEDVDSMDTDEPEYAGVFGTDRLDGLELMDTDEPEYEEVFDTSRLNKIDFMDISGRPGKGFCIVGARISEDTKEKREEFTKEWFAGGGDLQGYYERLREDRDSQWNRVFSSSGICPTITTTEPPVILVCKEVPTCTDPYDLEKEPELYEPVEVEPLW